MIASSPPRGPLRALGMFVLMTVALVALLATAGCGSATTAASSVPAATPTATTRQKDAAPAKTSGKDAAKDGGASARDGSDRAPDGVDRERIAGSATWAPGQLDGHFDKHGREGDHRSAAQYDASARETIRVGTAFTYRDRESNAERLGFYDKPGNRFTGVTRDGRRITTHFRPDRGEGYVRNLEASTYR